MNNKTEQTGRVIRCIACLSIAVEDLTYLLGLKKNFFIHGKVKNLARQITAQLRERLEYFAGDTETHDTLLAIEGEVQKSIFGVFKKWNELTEEVKQEKEQTNELQDICKPVPETSKQQTRYCNASRVQSFRL